jgi:glycosyltransferase involved in cell wall biosynthesis
MLETESPSIPSTIKMGGEFQINQPRAIPVSSKNKIVSRPAVSVIIPTLNESENLPLVIPYLPMRWIDEVIIVDGRSTDNTVDVAKQLLSSIKIVMEENKGKGAALRAGYKAAQGDILIVIDADGSHDPREIPRYIIALLEGADFVKGSRFSSGGGTTDMTMIRKLGNAAFVHLANLLFGVQFTDLCYGYHAFWRYCLDSIDLENVDGFEIDTSLYLEAVRARMRLVEVPSFEGYRFHGVGKLQTIPDGSRVLRTILMEWLNAFRKNNGEAYLGFRGSNRAYSGFHAASLMVDSSSSIVNENLHFLKLLSLLATGQTDTRYMIGRILQMALLDLNAVSGSLILLDETGSVREGCTAYNGKTHHTDSWSELVHQGLAGWVIKNCEPALIADTFTDPRWVKREWDDQPVNRRSVIAIPLTIDDRVIGVLTLSRSTEMKFLENEFYILSEHVMRHSI